MRLPLFQKSAFTLIEMLVSISITAALMGVGAGVYLKTMSTALAARELAAGRVLITSYLTAAQENNGELLAGYDKRVHTVTLPDGATTHGEAAHRYPFRIAPYFDSGLRGALLAGDNQRQINVKNNYAVSLYPSFGINYFLVGGSFDIQGKLLLPQECATRLSQVDKPSSLLVFATAGGYDASGKVISGYCFLRPPRLVHPMWSAEPFTKGDPPGNYGEVHARHDGKALCAFLDGSVRAYSIEELRDMRLWSSKAASLDDPNYAVSF